MRPLLPVVAALAFAASGALAVPTAPPRPTKARPHAAKTTKKRINLDVQNADIRNVVRLIGDTSGQNFVIGDDVKGRVTIKLRNVPWDEALDVILATKDLGKTQHGDNIIRIAPRTVLEEERARRLDRADECQEKGPLTTRLIPVNYGRAADMAPLVKATLTKRGTVTFDERTNTLIVRDVDCP